MRRRVTEQGLMNSSSVVCVQEPELYMKQPISIDLYEQVTVTEQTESRRGMGQPTVDDFD